MDDVPRQTQRQPAPPSRSLFQYIEKPKYLCQREWEDNDMNTMKEFLVWYNNKDVVPMLEAIEKMFRFYKNRHIDMFKDSISVTGLTLKYMFQDLPDYFTLPDEKNKDMYDLCKNGIVEGPSIVFHRYHEEECRCNNICTSCHKIHEKTEEEDWMYCNDCNCLFNGERCYTLHTQATSKGHSTCKSHYRCKFCGQTINKKMHKQEHKCGEIYCKTCKYLY